MTARSRDPLAVKSSLKSIVSGVEYEKNWLSERITAVTFWKHYFQPLDTICNETTADGRELEKLNSTTRLFGMGTSWRAYISHWLLGKFSYEWATRLPHSEKGLGNNADIVPSPKLKPELSHNFNSEALAEFPRTAIGAFNLRTTGFWREWDDVVVRRPLFDGYHRVMESVSLDDAREFPGYHSLGVIDGHLFVAQEEQVLTKFQLTDALEFEEAGADSFANYGVDDGGEFWQQYVVRNSLAYVSLEVTKNVLWNHSTMEVLKVRKTSRVPLQDYDGQDILAGLSSSDDVRQGRAVADVPCTALQVQTFDEEGNTYWSVHQGEGSNPVGPVQQGRTPPAWTALTRTETTTSPLPLV